MTYLIYGAVGALLILSLLMGGFLLGWMGNGIYAKHTCKRAGEEATEEQRRQFAAQQQAFESMLNYNQDTAYGLSSGVETVLGGDGL